MLQSVDTDSDSNPMPRLVNSQTLRRKIEKGPESGLNVKLPDAIWLKYQRAYDGETQGCCLLIADEIQRALGGDIVAGELTWYGGACRRTHW